MSCLNDSSLLGIPILQCYCPSPNLLFLRKKKKLVICISAGFGCDTSAVINILAHRDATHRFYIQQEYKTMYSEDLVKRLISELSGKLEVLI